MRVRLYSLSGRPDDRILWLDHFPVTLVEEPGGELTPGAFGEGTPLCVLHDLQGNLVLEAYEDIRVNESPMERGGISPGDILGIGEQRFLVSYERTTSSPLPPRRYRIHSVPAT